MEDFIKYELINHECYYIGDFTEVALIMKSYYKEMSEKEIYDKVKSVYDSVREKSYSDIDEGSIGI